MRATGQRAASDQPPVRHQWSVSDWWTPGLVAALLLAGSAIMASRPWWPTGDLALLQLRIGAMPADFPLVGVYSRFGWWHPGPVFLIFTWIGSTIGGGANAALLMSMAVLHVAVLIGAWWLARSVNLVAAQALMFAGVVSLLVRPLDQVLTPWNPYVGLAGVLLLVAAGWALCVGRPAGAFVLLPWGSFLVQSHVGYLPVVAAVVLTALVLVMANSWWHQRGPRADAHGKPTVESETAFLAVPWRALAWGAAVSVVMWLAPLAQQVTGNPGNLGALVRQLGGESQGFSEGLATMRAGFTVPMELGPDFAGGLPVNSSNIPWLLLLPTTALLVALLRRQREQILAVLLVGAVLVAALVSVAGLTPPAFEYLVPWLPSVVWLSLTWSVWVLLDPFFGSQRWWPMAIGAIAVVTAAVVAAGLSTAQPPLASYGIAADELWSAVAADAATVSTDPAGESEVATTGPITVVGAEGDEVAVSVAQGMVARAVAAEADVALDEATASRLEQVIPGDGPGRTRYLVRTFTPGLPTAPGERVVATFDPFTPQQWAEITRINAQMEQPDLDPIARLALATKRAEIEQGQRAFQVVTSAA